MHWLCHRRRCERTTRCLTEKYVWTHGGRYEHGQLGDLRGGERGRDARVETARLPRARGAPRLARSGATRLRRRTVPARPTTGSARTTHRPLAAPRSIPWRAVAPCVVEERSPRSYDWSGEDHLRARTADLAMRLARARTNPFFGQQSERSDLRPLATGAPCTAHEQELPRAHRASRSRRGSMYRPDPSGPGLGSPARSRAERFTTPQRTQDPTPTWDRSAKLPISRDTVAETLTLT
jgi:hypothetical protein